MLLFPWCWSTVWMLLNWNRMHIMSNRCHDIQTRPKNLVNFCLTVDRLVGLVVRRPPRERKIPGSNPACDGFFSGSSHTSDLKIGNPVATLPGAWRYRDWSARCQYTVTG